MGEHAEDADIQDELSPEREQALCEAILRYQVGIDPNRLNSVLDLAAVGLVNSAWRNSPVEDWHAGGGPLDDGDMLRINAHTTWRVRQIVRRWRADEHLPPDASIALTTLDSDAVGHLAYRIFRWLTMPTRRLPTGTTLIDIAGDEFGEFRDHADGVLGGFAVTAERRGALYGLWRAAAHGGLACRHWWGTPTWPVLVKDFMQFLDDPNHPHWQIGDQERVMSPEPEQVADRALLRGTLLYRPWRLDADAANWIAEAGIGFLQRSIPELPDHVRNST